MAAKTQKKKPTPKQSATKTTKQAAEPTGHAKKGLEAEAAGLTHSVSNTKKANAVQADLPVRCIEIVAGFNPRQTITDIDDLANNIKTQGLINPPIVRPKPGTPGEYLLVAGQRRLTAVKKLKWPTIPVTIRTDLEADEAESLALAVAENSTDLDKPLTYIEVARACQQLQQKEGWSPARIAAHTGIQDKKVRRALDLMKAPEDIQAQVEKGKMGVMAAIRIAKAFKDDKKVAAAVMPQITPNMSEKAVAELLKKTAKEQGATAAPGKKANKQKGAAKAAASVTWKGKREKQEYIVEFSAYLAAATAAEKKTSEYSEVRGALAAILWDRGDLEDPFVPSENKKDWEDAKADAKTLKTFDAIVAAEAEKYEEEEEEETE